MILSAGQKSGICRRKRKDEKRTEMDRTGECQEGTLLFAEQSAGEVCEICEKWYNHWKSLPFS